jgi:hypothetical protein
MSALTFTNQQGTYTAAIYSGAVAPSVKSAITSVAVGSDVLLQSGPGRLVALVPHATYLTLSGVQFNAYDAGAPVSGGPIAASGHIPLGGLAAAAGVSGQVALAGVPVVLNIPFNSGLVVNSRSGQPGVTVVWTSGPSV